MLVIYGSRLYGRVDDVPGLFYVATRFGHVFWVPLIPLGSHVVLQELEDGWRGVPIGLSGRSVLAGYLRGLLLGGGLISLLLGTIFSFGAGGAETEWLAHRLLAIAPVGIVFGLISLVLWRHPSEQRFLELCERIGLDPHQPMPLDGPPAEPAAPVGVPTASGRLSAPPRPAQTAVCSPPAGNSPYHTVSTGRWQASGAQPNVPPQQPHPAQPGGPEAAADPGHADQWTAPPAT